MPLKWEDKMQSQLDNFGRIRKPYMVLCNPNGEELLALGDAFGLTTSLRFNALSELNFRYPLSIDNGETELDGYELLKIKRLILLEDGGYYLITSVEEDLDGASPVKNVSCISIDGELINKKLLVFSYTSIKFYDIIDPTDTLLQKIIEYIPSWTIGDVDVELTTKYRSFDVSDTTIFNFLMEDVEEAFECVFFFDYTTKTISVKTIENSTTETDIFFSFDNLIKKANFSELSDEITTVLYVYGGDGLDIRSVNPLGTNAIYDFTYYKTTDWMSSSLISKITAWETLVTSEQTNYANGLAALRTNYDNKYSYEADLDVLEDSLSAQETLLATAVQTGQDRTTILAEIASLKTQISDTQDLIDGEQSAIDSQISALQTITDSLSFDKNFTTSEYSELSKYFYENTYQNENIIQLDSMSPAQIQDQSQELYDQAVGVLAKLSQPRYEFSMESVNFTGLDEYSQFTSELDLGCTVTVQLKDGQSIEAILLEINTDYDDITKFSLTFGNRLRLDGSSFVYADIMGTVKRTGADVKFNSETWSNWDKYHKDDVSTFIVSALDASTNKVINASDQSFVIDQTGLRGRKTSGETYDDKQVWVTNNVLAFTDDGWATSALAIGEVTFPSGGTGYGMVGSAIVGTIIAGNSLAITSEDTSFTLDQNGAVLQNASFTVVKDDSGVLTSIEISPTSGIKITKDAVDTFYVDTSGNLTAGGFTINENQIYGDGTHYFDSSTNTLKWGALDIVGSNATFTGTISANKLNGDVDWSQIVDAPLPSDKFNGGYYSGDPIAYGAVNLGSSGEISVGTYSGGRVGMVCTSNMTIEAGGDLFLNSRNGTKINNLVEIYSSGYANSGFGTTISYTVTTPYGNKNLYFCNGILTYYD